MGATEVLSVVALAVFAGGLFWLLTWPLAVPGPWWRLWPAFPDLVLNAAAEPVRRQLQRCGNRIRALVSAALAVLVVFLVLSLFARISFSALAAYLLFAVACVLAVIWGIFLVVRFRDWRALRFSARADSAIGAALARMALQNHRVFHTLTIGGTCIDHVVAGPRGVFAIKVVARRPMKGKSTVRLNERRLEFLDGVWLVDPLLEVERGARLLAEIVSCVANHPLAVRAVLAAPGWDVVQDQDGDILLVNEKTAVMLLGWSRPADHLMGEDIPALQDRLVRLCINRRL